MNIVIVIFVLKTNGPATACSASLGVKFIYLFFLERNFLLMASFPVWPTDFTCYHCLKKENTVYTVTEPNPENSNFLLKFSASTIFINHAQKH